MSGKFNSVAMAELENGRWILGRDGLPVNPNADSTCTICKGFGIVENHELSWLTSVLVDCICTKRSKEDSDKGSDKNLHMFVE